MLKLNRNFFGTAIVLSCFMRYFVDCGCAEDALWTTDFAAAKAQAKAEKKLLLVDFTGSDWCGWCRKLKAEVFSKEYFTTEAPKQFVLVELDYPKTKKLPEDLTKQNHKLAGQYKVHGYPTILLLDADGAVVAHTGYSKGGPEAYVKQLNEFGRYLHKNIGKMKQELADAKGLDRAKLLDKIVDGYAKLKNESGELAGWSKEIVALDPDNKAGLRVKHEFRMLMAEKANELKEGHKYKDAAATLNKAVALDGATSAQKQTAYMAKAELCFMQKDFAGVVECAENMIKADPKGLLAAQGKALLKQYKPMAEAQETVARLKKELEKSEGVERAKLLDQLVDALPKLGPLTMDPGRARDIAKYKKEIVALDAENKAGLKTKYELRDLVDEAAKFAKSKDAEKAQAALEKARSLPGLNDEQKATIEKSTKVVEGLQGQGLRYIDAFVSFKIDVRDLARRRPAAFYAADHTAARPCSFRRPSITRSILSKEIKPIFEGSCIECHGRGKEEGGFKLDSRDTFLKGGDTGPAIILGKSANSLLIELVQGFDPDGQMPKKGKHLTPQQVGLLRALWIESGGKMGCERPALAGSEPNNLKPRTSGNSFRV